MIYTVFDGPFHFSLLPLFQRLSEVMVFLLKIGAEFRGRVDKCVKLLQASAEGETKTREEVALLRRLERDSAPLESLSEEDKKRRQKRTGYCHFCLGRYGQMERHLVKRHKAKMVKLKVTAEEVSEKG